MIKNKKKVSFILAMLIIFSNIVLAKAQISEKYTLEIGVENAENNLEDSLEELDEGSTESKEEENLENGLEEQSIELEKDVEEETEESEILEESLEETVDIEGLDKELKVNYELNSNIKQVNNVKDLEEAFLDEDIDTIIINEDINLTDFKDKGLRGFMEIKRDMNIIGIPKNGNNPTLFAEKGVSHINIGEIGSDKVNVVHLENLNFEPEEYDEYQFTGGIANRLGKLTIKNCNFNKIKSVNAPVENNGYLKLDSNINFKDNMGMHGGAILNTGILDIDGIINFEKNTSTNGADTGSGGAIYNGYRVSKPGEDDLYIINISSDSELNFINNKVDMDGGAIYNLGKIDFKGKARFEDNEAGQYGGAIFNTPNKNLDYSSQIDFDGEFKFKNNKAEDSGGAIYNIGEISINKDILFEKNEATKDGGAIYNNINEIEDWLGKIETENNAKITFRDNIAVNGGAIYANSEIDYKSDLLLDGRVDFINNESEHSGGAVYNKSNTTLKGNFNINDNKAN